jgi:prepilin-type processing-associated H-X9-DG protein/prepilin-type N-terminal cleavage/methylation domain-containing protein
MFPRHTTTAATAPLDACHAAGELHRNRSRDEPQRVRLAGAPVYPAAYSLVEVLVTVAIIAVLAALSFPVLSAYRKSAHQAQCIANLKQLSRAVATYSAENNGLIPGPVLQAGDIWLLSLPPYLDRTNQDLPSRATPFCCPAARREYKSPNFTATYSMNGNLLEVGPLGYSQVRLQSFTQPSKTAMIMDGQLALMPPYWRHQVSHGADFPNKRDFVHDGSINILFADGHVETRKEEQIPRSGSEPFWKHNVQ